MALGKWSRSSSFNITWTLVRDTNYWAPPAESGTLKWGPEFSAGPPGYSGACQLRSTGLGQDKDSQSQLYIRIPWEAFKK